MKIKHTHIAVIAGIILLSGCTSYPKNYTYSPTVNVSGDSAGGVTLPSPFAKKPQPVYDTQVRQAYYQEYTPRTVQVEYTHYRVPTYPDYPPYRCGSRQVYYNSY
jgi:hypothetical protein